MDANDFLMGGGGAPTAKFPTPGTIVGGRITQTPTVEQQRDIKTGEAKVWSDGAPMMQMVVTIQTEQRDPAIENDDGKRRIFVKGQLKAAVAEAVKKAGAPGLEIGGTLNVRYDHDGEVKQRGFSPPKQYAAQYIPAAQAEFGAPASAPAPQAAPPGVNPQTGEIGGQFQAPPGLTPQQTAAAQQHPQAAAALGHIPQQATTEPPF